MLESWTVEINAIETDIRYVRSLSLVWCCYELVDLEYIFTGVMVFFFELEGLVDISNNFKARI